MKGLQLLWFKMSETLRVTLISDHYPSVAVYFLSFPTELLVASSTTFTDRLTLKKNQMINPNHGQIQSGPFWLEVFTSRWASELFVSVVNTRSSWEYRCFFSRLTAGDESLPTLA